jgi:queuine tRNA-ribosyltransferase
MKFFTLKKQDKNKKARRGQLQTHHGDIQTPFFMPVGTNGTVKCMTFEDMREVNAQIVLSNTYHLYVRPGTDVLQKAGGLHNFIGWDGPMLTDSGGYQVFSLSKLRKLSDDGVKFKSHLDGAPIYFTPENVMETQKIFGTDMVMPLDICAPYPCKEKEAYESVVATTQWAKRSRDHFLKTKMNEKQFSFGIVQGSVYKDLREQSAREITDIDFDGFAIGGVSVGEPVDEMFKALDNTIGFLPEDKPRYFMGIGLPDQIVKAVGMGVDMFDTVLPTRFGRHATAFTREGKIVLRNACFTEDFSPIDKKCQCLVCQKYTRSYLRHLVKQNEITGLKLISYHNLYFYINLMKEIREAIDNDTYVQFEEFFLKEYGSPLYGGSLEI